MQRVLSGRVNVASDIALHLKKPAFVRFVYFGNIFAHLLRTQVSREIGQKAITRQLVETVKRMFEPDIPSL